MHLIYRRSRCEQHDRSKRLKPDNKCSISQCDATSTDKPKYRATRLASLVKHSAVHNIHHCAAYRAGNMKHRKTTATTSHDYTPGCQRPFGCHLCVDTKALLVPTAVRGAQLYNSTRNNPILTCYPFYYCTAQKQISNSNSTYPSLGPKRVCSPK